ncbi:MAG: L,D-transpeptidase [Pseudomonadota bacterium]
MQNTTNSAHRVHGARPFLVLLLLTLLWAAASASIAKTDAMERWVLVDTSALTLAVMEGDDVVLQYDNIAIGSNGPTLAKLVSDETTPLGEFRINRINQESRYHLFFALDYPTMEHAKRALVDGRLSAQEYDRVRNAWQANRPPPQNTSLGGHLGIHGLGGGSEEIHGLVNWTDGCIALTDTQIEELAELIGIGTRVSVR